jgi:hypothetical protein
VCCGPYIPGYEPWATIVPDGSENALIVRPPGQLSDVKAAGYSQFSQETVKFLLLNRVVRGGLASNHGRGSHKVFGKRSTDLPRSRCAV